MALVLAVLIGLLSAAQSAYGQAQADCAEVFAEPLAQFFAASSDRHTAIINLSPQIESAAVLKSLLQYQRAANLDFKRSSIKISQLTPENVIRYNQEQIKFAVSEMLRVMDFNSAESFGRYVEQLTQRLQSAMDGESGHQSHAVIDGIGLRWTDGSVPTRGGESWHRDGGYITTALTVTGSGTELMYFNRVTGQKELYAVAAGEAAVFFGEDIIGSERLRKKQAILHQRPHALESRLAVFVRYLVL